MIAKIILYISFILLIVIYNLNLGAEHSNKPHSLRSISKKEKTNIIGDGRVVQVSFIRPIAPHPAVPLIDHVMIRTVKVPLIPFKAPLITLPKLKTIPPFLLYKMEYLTKPRNQGDCGCCWAFALCDMLSDRAIIQSGTTFNMPLSVQQVLSCFERNGCDGGSPEDACMWLAENQTHLFSEKAIPFKQGTGGYVNSSCPKSYDYNKYIKVQKDSVASIVTFIEEKETNETKDEEILKQNIINMKTELIKGGPFYCAMTVYDDLFTYDGLQPYKPSKNATFVGGHAIEVIGYCEKGQDPRKGFGDVGYWICKNSWGGEWPLRSAQGGFFTIVMGKNICGVESRCGFGNPLMYGMGEINRKNIKQIEELRYDNFEDYLII